MRTLPLTTIKGGINRLRTKGGARADTLYDAVNCYETDSGAMARRPGTVTFGQLPSSTKGLCSFNGSFHVFAHETVAVDPEFTLHVLGHPDSVDSQPIELTKIHFAKPFMGFLYVVAEYVNGDVFHFWLQSAGPWEANKVYKAGDVIEPTTPNGLYYKATRLGSPNQAWAAKRPRTVGDVVEPTEYNDFFYTVVDTIGDSPISGTVEPDWPEADGAQVFEDTEGFADQAVQPVSEPTNLLPGSATQDRYGAPPGGRFIRGF